jgi:acetyltransferase-like isoleucine patch superfamily enzyme
LQNPRQIVIGDFVTLHQDVWLSAHESEEKVGPPSLIIDGPSLIGRRSHIFAKNRIHIEADVISAASVLIQDHGPSFDDPSIPIRYQGAAKGGTIRIGRGTWIGQGAAIVCEDGELTLGPNCVVAANSVVTRSAPAYSLLSGNPARIVKQFDPSRGVWILGSKSAVKMDGTPDGQGQ